MSHSFNEPPDPPARYTKKLANKYLRLLPSGLDNVDVYDVLAAFDVRCPGLQHAIKKLLCTGIRGHKDAMNDLLEARQALDRAIDFQAFRDAANKEK